MSNMSYNIAHFIGELSVVGYGMLDIQKLNFTQLLLLLLILRQDVRAASLAEC